MRIWEVHFTTVIMPKFSVELIKFHWYYFFLHLCGYLFCRTMSVGSSQCRVQQRTKETRAAFLAKMENKQAILERNVLKADVMVAPLDCIAEIIKDIFTNVHA
jgi:hypothetical protein